LLKFTLKVRFATSCSLVQTQTM